MPGIVPLRYRQPNPTENMSNGYPTSSRHPSVSGSYYYVRGGIGPSNSPVSSNVSSPAMAGNVRFPQTSKSSGMPNSSINHGSHQVNNKIDIETPSYWVEHLATFAVGREFGLISTSDGLRKLKQLEKNSAIWAQPMVLRLKPNVVSVEDENGDLVEQFPIDLVTDPSAHLSNDPRDVYNNILLFIVKEDRKRSRTVTPTEIHIFQCNKVSAAEVVEDIEAVLAGSMHRVRKGRRETGFSIGPVNHPPSFGLSQAPFGYRDDVSASSDSSEYFERDVNTLNRCFDDIERFVARIQSAAIAQKELEAQNYRYRTAQRKRRTHIPSNDAQNGILQMRAQLPAEMEFVDILQKFKLSFNLLAKLKNHIHEPNAPELLHFLFTPLMIILDSCHWGIGRNIAPQVVSPLLSRDACDLMKNCLTSKETDIWMALGQAWRVPPEDWAGPLPVPYRPIFMDGFAPYGVPNAVDVNVSRSYSRYPPVPHPHPQPIHRGMSAPPPQTHVGYHSKPPIRDRSVDNLNIDFDRMTLEKERLNFEKEKIADLERRLYADERRLQQEKQRLAAEREMISQELERRSLASSYNKNAEESRSFQESPSISMRTQQYSETNGNQMPQFLGPIPQPDQSPRQKAFIDDILSRRAKLVQVTYDRIAQNPKELTVTRGEYLEVLNDKKNWWECLNVHRRNGYVPHTILSVVNMEQNVSPHSLPPQDPSFSDRVGTVSMQKNQPISHSGPALSPHPGMMSDDTPDYIKKRQGKRGEFRYF